MPDAASSWANHYGGLGIGVCLACCNYICGTDRIVPFHSLDSGRQLVPFRLTKQIRFYTRIVNTDIATSSGVAAV